MSEVDIFADDMLGSSSICEPITEDELKTAESFDSLPNPDDENDDIGFFVRVQENREGRARSKDDTPIVDDRPVILESKTFSMHRLLWVDGTRVVYKTDKEDKTTATPQKATFAVFKLYFDSRTKSSGTGTDKAVECARIQVDFHGVEPETGRSEVQRPRVIGWAPFATMARPNETAAQLTSDSSVHVSVNGGAPQAGGAVEATASSSRAWKQPFYEKYYSRPVSISGPKPKKTADATGTQNDYNGVSWIMEQNSLTREGIVSSLLVYLLIAREDDSEYAVRISARVGTRSLRNFGHNPEHKCVLRVTPRDPDDNEPAVCSLEGQTMLDQLDVNHFEKLLSSSVDTSLDLPWEKREGAKGTKSGTLGTSTTTTTTGAKTAAVVPESAKNDKVTVGAYENSRTEGFEDSKNNENENNVFVQPNATLTTELKSAMQTEKRNATVPLDDLGLASAVTDALRGVSEEGGHKNSNEEYNLAAQVAMLESRMEVMEYQMSRQALVIRALLKRAGQ
ncbi:hypothetical protein SEUCBS139899_001134 [Sporothrix eucalyptigena]|uniref:C2 NT-type domain-containing protein n=1 Tax=Sporothrix eucalyptigena TaxID=1812306 RepID=A0ABP0B657_9PEZI